jgi:hypothetical protein
MPDEARAEVLGRGLAASRITGADPHVVADAVKEAAGFVS